jgi:hypothetical protein
MQIFQIITVDVLPEYHTTISNPRNSLYHI